MKINKMFEIIRSELKGPTNPYYNIPIGKAPSAISIISNTSDRPNPNTNFKLSYSITFKVYFNFTFFLCISPFRISESFSNWDKTKRYKLKKSAVQMALCGFIHLLIIYNYLVAIRNIKFKQLAHNPVVYFEMFQTISNSFYRIAFCIMMWTKQQRILKVVEFSGDLAAPSDKVWKRITPMAILLCIFYTGMSLTCGVLGDEYASHASHGSDTIATNQWTFASILYTASGKIQYMLFLSNSSHPSVSTNATDVMDMNVSDILFGILGLTSSIARNLCTFLSNLFLLLVTVSLAIHSKALYKLISYRTVQKKEKQEKNGQLLDFEIVNLSVDVVLSKYKGLRELSTLVNINFGHLMLLYVLTSIATIATYLDTVIVEPDLFTKIRIAWSINTFIIILTVGSNICTQISGLKTWLARGENCQKLPLCRLIIFLNEVDDYPVGISGMGLFTINFKFVTGLVSTLVTYFIIMLQFQVAVREEN